MFDVSEGPSYLNSEVLRFEEMRVRSTRPPNGARWK